MLKIHKIFKSKEKTEVRNNIQPSNLIFVFYCSEKTANILEILLQSLRLFAGMISIHESTNYKVNTCRKNALGNFQESGQKIQSESSAQVLWAWETSRTILKRKKQGHNCNEPFSKVCLKTSYLTVPTLITGFYSII